MSISHSKFNAIILILCPTAAVWVTTDESGSTRADTIAMPGWF